MLINTLPKSPKGVCSQGSWCIWVCRNLPSTSWVAKRCLPCLPLAQLPCWFVHGAVLEMVSAGTSNKRPCFAVVPNGVSGFLFIAFAMKAQIRSTSLYLWKVGWVERKTTVLNGHWEKDENLSKWELESSSVPRVSIMHTHGRGESWRGAAPPQNMKGEVNVTLAFLGDGKWPHVLIWVGCMIRT